MTFQDFEKWREGIRLDCDRMTSFTAEDAEVNQDTIDQLIVNEIISEIVEATNKIFNDHLEKHGISTTSDHGYSICNDVRKGLHALTEPKAKREPKTKTRVDYNCKLGIWKKRVIAEAIAEKFGELFEDAAECVISSQEAMYDINVTDEDRDDIVVMARNKLRKAIDIAPTAEEETKMSIWESHIYTTDYTCHIKLDRISGVCDQAPTYEFHGETTDIDKMLSRIKKRGGMPIANRIWQNDGRHTTVEWRDGTKTTVCCEDPEKYTEWGGFCACVVKKLYGSATKAELELQTAKETTAWPAKKKQIEREKMKAMKQMAARHKKELREQKIADKMEEMRITNEAGHRLAKEYSEKETAVAAEEG